MSQSDDDFVLVDKADDIQLGVSPPDDFPNGPELAHAALSGSQHSRLAAEYEYVAYPSDDEGSYVHDLQGEDQKDDGDERQHQLIKADEEGDDADADSTSVDALDTQIGETEASVQTMRLETPVATQEQATAPPLPAVDPARDAAVEKELRRVQEENKALRKKLESPPTEDTFHITSSTRIYACRKCRTHIGTEEDVVSKEFCGVTGRAYFVNHVYNVKLGPIHECVFKTGKHLIADLLCQTCDTMGPRVNIGWKYLKSGERSQKYKEGKFVLEEALLQKTGSW